MTWHCKKYKFWSSPVTKLYITLWPHNTLSTTAQRQLVVWLDFLLLDMKVSLVQGQTIHCSFKILRRWLHSSDESWLHLPHLFHQVFAIYLVVAKPKEDVKKNWIASMMVSFTPFCSWQSNTRRRQWCRNIPRHTESVQSENTTVRSVMISD